MTILPPPDAGFDAGVDVLIVGAGACGLTAALAASDAAAGPGAGPETLIVERDARPAGSTAMSSGFVPAAGTRAQRAMGVADDARALGDDIMAKSGGRADPELVRLAAERIGPTLDWLEARHGLEWIVLDGFLYPGHSRHRMHAVPERTGAALMARLLGAVEAAGPTLLTSARVTALHAQDGLVLGARIERPDGAVETVACRALVLACNGFGGNRELVARHIPAMADAPYFGHPGNTGDALRWGTALGAEARRLSGCQGHGSLAHPQGALVTWALMTEGGVQVNAEGRRFHDESAGYSEAALPVLAQPGGVAWDLFDDRLLALARTFPDFRALEAAGAVRSGADADALAAATGLPADALRATLAGIRDAADGRRPDPFGRRFDPARALAPPFHAVRVTGALFHTQGGLAIGPDARVLRPDGTALPNLFAGGGAACGVSGPDPSGYLSGNGLLTALAFGALAGGSAARI